MYHVNPLVELGIAGRVGGVSRELNALSDGQLSDIGIDRSQIHDIAEALARRVSRSFKWRLASRGMSLTPLMRAYTSA